MTHREESIGGVAVSLFLLALCISLAPAGSVTGDSGGNATSVPAGNVTTETAGNVTAEEIWSDKFEGDTFLGGAITANGYVLAGGNGKDGWIVGTDKAGAVQWTRAIQDSGYTRFEDVVALPDGGFLAVGFTHSNSPYAPGSPIAVRLAANGSVSWQQRYRGDCFWNAEVLPDGGIVIAGTGPAAVVALDPETGDIDRERFSLTNAWDVEPLANGSSYAFAVNGDRGSKPRIVITEPNGTVIARHRYGEWGDKLTGLDRASDGRFVASGIDYDEERVGHGWGFRTTPDMNVDWTARPETVTLDAIAGVNGTILIGSTNAKQLYWIRQNRTVARLPFYNGVYDIERGANVALVTGRDGASVAAAAVVALDPHDVTVNASSRPAEHGIARVAFEADVNPVRHLERVRWDFDGDGTVDATTTEPITQHTYEEPGTYSVTVTAVGPAGTRVSETHAITVTDETPPRAQLKTPPNGLVAANRSTRLSANGSVDNHEIAEYRWDIGADGSIEARTDTPFLTHTFNGSDRSFRVAVTIVDEAGNSNSTAIRLQTAPNDVPVIANVTTSSIGRATYVFEASVTNRVGQLNVTWTFPDGTTKQGSDVRYQFPAAGQTYTVQVTASDGYGATVTNSVEMSVPHRTTRRGHRSWVARIGAVLIWGWQLLYSLIVAL